MNVVYKSIGYIRQWYSQVNPATLTGAIDILVVEQPDGTLVASPFHVRFGKLGVLRAKEKLVNIAINDEKIGDIHMKLGDQGEAFFLEECGDEDAVPVGLITSPLPSRPSTPTEEAVADDDFDKDLYGAMLSMEEGGKRKRRRKRKRRSIISASNTSLLDDSKTGGASSSSEVEDEEKAPLPSVVDNQDQDGCGKSAVERTMSVESTDAYELAECCVPTVRISKVSNGATESDSSIHFSDDWNSEEEGTAFSPMRCVLSDSELPMLSSKAIPFKSSPFSDSEAVENRNQSDVMWGWGQLPGRNEQDHESSSDDAGNFAGNDDGEKALATAPDETHFRAIEPMEEDTVRVEDETAPATKKTRTISSNSHGSSSGKRRDTEGLYLDDVLSLEPSEANVYLQKTSRTPYNSVSDSTFASTAGGQADSIMQAAVAEPLPSTAVERAASPAGGSDIDSGTDCQTTEDTSDGMSEQQDNIEITISLCGFISGSNNVDKDKFEEKQVTFDAFLQNPLTIVNDPNLVICMGGSRYLNWQAAAPVIMSLTVFKQPLSQESMERVIQSAQPQPQTNRLMGWLWRRPSRIDQQSTVDGGSAPPSPVKIGQPGESRQSIGTSYSAASSSENEVANILHEELQRTQSARELLPSKREQRTTGAKPSSSTHSNGRPMRKSTRLGSEQLKTLCLQPGANTITFSVTTQFQGTTRCVANVFLWKWSDKLVVSDIDGTITKSDVMGQILPVVGKDWTQGGVAQLYQNINNNGYKFIYVSSRAIGQASMTKGYLNWINQHGVSLPAGPLLLSPTSLMMAFRREVIEKKPEKFKIECLKDIKALFPGNPFVAGFGNKSNDVMAYSAVGVPSNRMFTINPRGELKHEKLPTYTTSYTGLGELVDSFFPMLDKEQDFVRAHDYSDFTYWRQDLEAFSDQFDQFQLA